MLQICEPTCKKTPLILVGTELQYGLDVLFGNKPVTLHQNMEYNQSERHFIMHVFTRVYVSIKCYHS